MNLRMKQAVYAAMGVLLLAGGLIVMIQGASASSEPVAEGLTIRLAGDGWWQVQDSDNNYANICEGEISSCQVPHAGTYQVINHTTGEKWNINASPSSPSADRSDEVQDEQTERDNSGSRPAAPVADGMTIRITGDGWWQVQDSDNNYANICEGEISSCQVPHAGTYQVINHTISQKWNITIGAESTEAAGDSGNTNRLNTPVFRSVATSNDGYVSVIWAPTDNADGVHVYRDDQKVATVTSGNVFNDYEGRVGSSYQLVAFKDNQESEKSESKAAAAATEGAWSSLSAEGAEIFWTPQPNTSYAISRQDKGGAIRPNRGTVLARNLTNGFFLDENPRRGASYGIEGTRSDGTVLPVVTVAPNYDSSAAPTEPTAFELTIEWRGAGEYRVASLTSGFECTKNAEPGQRYCDVPSPGDYRVTHMESGATWIVTAKRSPITPTVTIINGVRVAGINTDYGSILIPKDAAEVKAITGINPLPPGGVTFSSSFRSTFAAKSNPPDGNKVIYSVTKPGKTAQETSSQGTIIVSVYKKGSDGGPGDTLGHWIHGEYVSSEEYKERVDKHLDRIDAVSDLNPGKKGFKALVRHAYKYITENVGTAAPDKDDNDDDEPGCQNSIHCGGHQDLDNDGLPNWLDDDDDGDGINDNIDGDSSTPYSRDTDGDGINDLEDFDDDNDGIPDDLDLDADGDGIPHSEDQDDRNPDVGRAPGGNSGGDNSGGDDSNGDTNSGGTPTTTGGGDTNTDGGPGGLTGGGQQQQHNTTGGNDSGNNDSGNSGGTPSSTGAGGGSNSGFNMA